MTVVESHEAQRWYQRIRNLEARVTGNSASIDGVTTTVAGLPGADTLAPAAPVSVTVTSSTYLSPAGQTFVQADISWVAVTTNSDGSACTDLDGYLVSYLVHPNGAWASEQYVAGSSTELIVQGFVLGQVIDVRVRAQDTSGNKGAYTTVTSISLTTDTTPPNQPSTPTVTGLLAGIRVVWDGKDSGGAAMPADFGHYEVHQSTSSGFTPSPSTLVDSLPTAGGASTIPLNDYGTTHYVKIVAYDLSGNPSTPSAQASGTPSQAVDTDILDAAITAAKIATDAVTVEKLTVGSLSDSAFLNPDFEDVSSTDPTMAAGWQRAGSPWTGTVVLDTTSPINGSKSMKLTPSGTSSGNNDALFGNATAIPVTPGDTWYISAMVKGSVSGAQFQALAFNGPLTISATVIAATSVTTTATRYEGSFVVPSGMTSMFVGFYGLHTSPSGASLWVDDAIAHRMTTSAQIVDAAIVTAKIANLAVDTAQIANAAIVAAKIGNLEVGTAAIASLAVTDAKIGDCSITKLTAGTLFADMTVSARIKTANSGQRVELNGTGLQCYNSGGTLTVDISSGTASITGGTITGGVVQTAASGARVELNGSASRLEIYDSFGLVGYLAAGGAGGAGSSEFDLTNASTGATFYMGTGGNGISGDFVCDNMTTHSIGPQSDNAYGLGSVSFRWSSINTVALGTSGSVTMSSIPVGTIGSTAGFNNSGTTTLLRSSSSARYKINIDYDKQPDYSILNLRALKYEDKHKDLRGRKYHGFIAEDVVKTHPDLVVYDEDGKTPGGLMYDRIPVLLIPVVRDIHERLNRLEQAAA